MTSLVFFRTACAAALLAGLACIPAAASAQQGARLDGYCYVRQSDMQRNSTVDSYGVKRSYARCYNGVYYAYSGESYSAPAAPDGYQVAYYTRRPGQEYYDRVVDADSRYQSDSRYSTSTYTGGDRYATTSGYGISAYGSTAYGGERRSSDTYAQDPDAYEDGRHGGDRYAYDLNDDRDYGRGYGRSTAVEGWRDDSGQWHLGRPRAVGWQDDSGRWHVGEVEAYGWRDARGQWHESRDDDDNGGADSRYGY